MYAKILVGTDGSETAENAVRHAARLARMAGAELLLLHVAPTVPGAPALGLPIPDPEAIRSGGREILERAEAAAGDDVKVRTLMLQGDPAEALLDTAEEEGVDLIVVGNRGMLGAKRFFLGSVPDRVAHHASCSVLIVHTT